MPIYDKSTNQLLSEYIQENFQSGTAIEKSQIVNWFTTKYPRIKTNTVNCHIIKFTANHKTRIHYSAKPKFDMLFQLNDGRLRLYNPETDPKPIYTSEDITGGGNDTGNSADDKESAEFAYESHLRDYLKNNLHIIEPDLRLYTDEEDDTITGVEYDAGGKRIDILAVDKNGQYVVIELKVSKGYERTMGQILRYIGWVKKNLAEDGKARGIIIAKNITDDLKLATGEVSNIELFEYDLKIDLRKINLT